MDSLSSVSPSIVLPLRRHHHYHYHYHHRRRHAFVPLTCDKSLILDRTTKEKGYNNMRKVWCSRGKARGHGEDGGDDDQESVSELERALRMDGAIPGSSDEFVKQVSSRAYDMRRNLHHTFDTSSYDVLEKNPWRETAKSVYVLTHQENKLCTMKTRRNRSEVERELGLLFSKRGNGRNKSKQSGASTQFQMVVEDVQEGVLVFEDQNEAARYCDLLQGGGQDCEGVAEIEASSVFDLCQKNRALAVLFRRGRTPPLPENLKLNLKARKRSLEDQL